jgi:glucosamine kinase
MTGRATFLGVDGGGTHTRAWLIDASGRVLGQAETGPCNPNNVGFDGGLAAIRSAARQARQASGLKQSEVRAAFVGCAGIKTEADGERLARRLLEEELAGRVMVRNDTEAALAGSLAGAPGIALIAGTGSFCLGRDDDGRTAHCGGWGWLLDDIGGAFWVGRETVRAAALAADGRGPATVLLGQVLAHFAVSEADALLSALYDRKRAPVSLAGLAPLATRAATEGDFVARDILQRGAAGAAELVARVALALAWEGPVPVAIVGGLGRSGPPYTPLLHAAIHAAVPAALFPEPRLPPVAGAALRALELGGVALTPPLLANLAASLSHDPTA